MSERVLVTGGRNFQDKAFVFSTLDRIHAERTIDNLIAGGAKGADFWAEEWAKDREVDHSIYPAKWKTIGNNSAGPIRNQRMLDKASPTLVVAFPGGPGTANMCRKAEGSGLVVIHATPTPGEKS